MMQISLFAGLTGGSTRKTIQDRRIKRKEICRGKVPFGGKNHENTRQHKKGSKSYRQRARRPTNRVIKREPIIGETISHQRRAKERCMRSKNARGPKQKREWNNKK